MEKKLFWIMVINAIVLEIWSIRDFFGSLGWGVHRCLFCVACYNATLTLFIELIGNAILLWGIFKVSAHN